MERAGISRTTFYRQFSDAVRGRRATDRTTRRPHGRTERGLATRTERGGQPRSDPPQSDPFRSRGPTYRLDCSLRSTTPPVSTSASGGSGVSSSSNPGSTPSPPRSAATKLPERSTPHIDADATALALSLMNEQLLLEMICRDASRVPRSTHASGRTDLGSPRRSVAGRDDSDQSRADMAMERMTVRMTGIEPAFSAWEASDERSRSVLRPGRAAMRGPPVCHGLQELGG